MNSQLRLGIIVPLHGKTAVERNQLKRRLREIGRIEMLPIILPAEIVIRALPSAYQAKFAELCAEVRKIAVGIANADLSQ